MSPCFPLCNTRQSNESMHVNGNSLRRTLDTRAKTTVLVPINKQSQRLTAQKKSVVIKDKSCFRKRCLPLHLLHVSSIHTQEKTLCFHFSSLLISKNFSALAHRAQYGPDIILCFPGVHYYAPSMQDTTFHFQTNAQNQNIDIRLQKS